MSVTLKIQPFSSPIEKTKSLSFVLSGLNAEKRYRIHFENATLSRDVAVMEIDGVTISANRILVDSKNSIQGKMDLSMNPSDAVSVVSIYANIEEKTEGDIWILSDIASFIFQIENSKVETTGDNVSIYPPFVTANQNSTIKIHTKPNSSLQVSVNGKRFVVKSNYNGDGSFSFRTIDILSGSEKSSKTIQKYPIYYSTPIDQYKKEYNSGSFLHFIPESVKVLQATNEPSKPECAIIDRSPGPGLTVDTLDDFCIDGAVVGPYSIFDKSDENSTYYNSKVGFCSDLKKIFPINTDPACRVYNSTSSTVLPNGSALVAFASQQTYSSDPYAIPSLASRIFVANFSTSLKYQGNPLRNGSILKPSAYYHSVTPSDIKAGEVYGLVFRTEDKKTFEIQCTASDDNIATFLSSFAYLLNQNSDIQDYGIRAVSQGDFLQLTSENKFSVQSRVVSGEGGIAVALNSNKTVALLTSMEAVLDEGDVVVFLNPAIGYQSHKITSRDYDNHILYLSVFDGFNNNIGPNISDNVYCNGFVVVKSTSPFSRDSLSEISPLPAIYDIFNQEMPCVNPSITSRIDMQTGDIYVYVVCQSPVSGVYQLFFYSFILGQSPINTQWRQITDYKENKNAKIKCDNMDNLHIVWEADRTGSTQVYYSVLGHCSNFVSNQMLMSSIDKNSSNNNEALVFGFSAPQSIQDSWMRMSGNEGLVSVSSDSEVSVRANPYSDAAMAVFHLSADEFGSEFPNYFNQLSYQVSFDLAISGITEEVLDQEKVEEEFKDWVNTFEPIGNFKYSKDNNVYTLDSYKTFFDSIIPFCGSYKIAYDDLNVVASGKEVSDESNNVSSYFVASDKADLVNQPNVRHFVIGLMPEKVKFRAKNTESFSQYCERVGESLESCTGFNNQIERLFMTGRFKMALLVATSDNPSSDRLTDKKYSIVREFGTFFDFRDSKNIKIAVHYSKASSDLLAAEMRKDRSLLVDENRYQGDIVVFVDNEPQLGHAFFADFSDGEISFDIGLGMPLGENFIIDESVPYKGNLYENGNIKQKFSNIAIGPHSIFLNRAFGAISVFDRNTRQMVIPERFLNSISNGGFESSLTPKQNESVVQAGDPSISSWNVLAPVTYYNIPRVEQTGLFRTLSGNSWIALGSTVSSVDYLGKIYQSVSTIPGKEYTVFFNISSFPSDDAVAAGITRTLRVTAGSVSSDYSSTSSSPSRNNWVTRKLVFTAVSNSTNITFENISSDAKYPIHIDSVFVVDSSNLSDSLNSVSTSKNLMVDDLEFALNYGLSTTNILTQLPVTISQTQQNKSPDFFIDKADKMHVVWQSNRNKFWDIYYSGNRNRMLPFRYETQITSSKSNSVNPSIAVDGKGRRLIAWQDNRLGLNQIYSAISKEIDETIPSQCKQDEVDTFLYNYKIELDPYFSFASTQTNCYIEFEVTTLISTLYHFSLSFYEDKEYTKLYKTISSENSIDGWFVNNESLSYNGFDATAGETCVVRYNPSRKDDLSNKVYYVIAEYQINSNPINLNDSSNIQIVYPYSGLDLRALRFQANNIVRVIPEFDGVSEVKVNSQTVSSLLQGSVSDTLDPITDISFEGSLTSLPGVQVGDKIKSIYLHFDPIEESQTVLATVSFISPIAAIFITGQRIYNSGTFFGNSNVIYPKTVSIGLEGGDSISISEDRKTITLQMSVSSSVSQMRIILENDAKQVGKNEFAYYCSSEQSYRCNLDCFYVNNSSVTKNVHFRATLYADAQRTSPILSVFTKADSLGWEIGNDVFPSAGLTVIPGQKISAIYQPEIIPFDIKESKSEFVIEQIIRQPLICGTTYYATIESFVDDIFSVESEFEFVCPCIGTKNNKWNVDEDSKRWVCSGQGFDDFRITKTDNNCLFPSVVVGELDNFYIVWQDYRFTRTLTNQPSLSPDYFAAFYDSESDEFRCSGQGSYDKRITKYDSEAGRVLYDASVIIDQFQNINLVAHDGKNVFSQSCSFGCEYISTPAEITKACTFTDSSDIFFVGDSPDRVADQYQKIRVYEKYVKFSTYVDLQKPIPVVSDCFIELDIIGVPGTMAYRLRNENDAEWSEWLPIGPNISSQSSDSSSTEEERNFFRAYFIQKDRFIAPWVASSGDGVKRVCCEILSFAGQSTTFCVDFMAIYDSLDYRIDLFFDEEMKKPIPKYKNYMVASTKKTETPINDEIIGSIKDVVSSVNSIYARIEFKNKNRIQVLEKLYNISRFSLSNQITMSVYQQGINDQINIPLQKIDEGVYRGSFSVEEEDGIVNIDGLANIVINVPGQCKPLTSNELINKASLFENSKIDQKVSVFNNFTIFRDSYNADDIKGSFGSMDYYKFRTFGVGGNSAGDFGNSKWIGGGNSPLNNDKGYKLPEDPPR